MKKELVYLGIINCLTSLNNVFFSFLFPVLAKEMGLKSTMTGILISVYLIIGFLACFSTTHFINFFGREKTFYITINLTVRLNFFCIYSNNISVIYLAKALTTLCYSITYWIGNEFYFIITSFVLFSLDGYTCTLFSVLSKYNPYLIFYILILFFPCIHSVFFKYRNLLYSYY